MNVFAQNIIGKIDVGNTIPKIYQEAGGFGVFISNILRLFFVVAGVYAFINIIIGGFQFISSGGDSKAVSAAWNRIWQSLFGLVIVVGSFALITLASYIIFGKAAFILNPQLYGP